MNFPFSLSLQVSFQVDLKSKYSTCLLYTFHMVGKLYILTSTRWNENSSSSTAKRSIGHWKWFPHTLFGLCSSLKVCVIFLFRTKNLLAFDKQNYTFKLIDHNNSFGNINNDDEVVRWGGKNQVFHCTVLRMNNRQFSWWN